jgi:hypothetical protein
MEDVPLNVAIRAMTVSLTWLEIRLAFACEFGAIMETHCSDELGNLMASIHKLIEREKAKGC